jgi:hypothetical protein
MSLPGCACARDADSNFKVSQLTATEYVKSWPQVSGGRVVWSMLDGPLDGDATDEDIFTWTPSDGVVQVTENEVMMSGRGSQVTEWCG